MAHQLRRLMSSAEIAALFATATIGAVSMETRADEPVSGRQVYEANCLSCHQADGRGVPRMQPSIVDSPWLAGDATALAAFVLTGGFDSAARSDTAVTNVMPPFDHLDDEALAAVLTYIRAEFGSDAGAVTVKDVKSARDSLSGRQ